MKVAWSGRLRRGALFFLIGLVLLIPRALPLRRRPRLWNGLRLVAALLGLALLGTMTSAGSGWAVPAAGALLIVFALLVPPKVESKSVDEQARELGALVVLNGGHFQRSGRKTTPVRLFVSLEQVFVRDLKHRPVAEIPLTKVASVRAEEAASGWRLLVEWNQETAAFHFDGFFAEHLARVAETTLRSQLRRELPVVGR